MPWVLIELMKRVYPSPWARLATCAPMLPPAPGRLSTTTVWPQVFDSSEATVRVKKSEEPPGGNETIIDTDFDGYPLCASAGAPATASVLMARSAAARETRDVIGTS